MDTGTKELVNIGTLLCQRLKNIYCNKEPWISSHARISKGFSLLKQKARIYYPEMSDSNILKQLSKYSDPEIRELMKIGLEISESTNEYGLNKDTSTAIELYSKLVG